MSHIAHMTDDDIRSEMEQAIKAVGGDIRFCRLTGIRLAHVYAVRSGTKAPSPRLLRLLGYEVETRRVKRYVETQ